MKNNKFYAMSTDEILKKFQTSEEGLTSKEATKRINKYGYNELPRKKPDSILKIFLNELLDPIVLILIVAIFASILVGEIVDAIHRAFGNITLDGIKRRCRPGMGRCQGGFCGPKVQEIIARELNKDIINIEQEKKGSYILTGKTK